MTTTIFLNDQEYNLEQLIKIHTSGVYQPMGKDVTMLDVEDAAVVATIADYITVASKSGLKVLVRPSTPTEKSGIYILGKYLLKKCLTTVRYETTPTASDRYISRGQDGQRPNYRAPRQGFGDRSRSQNFRRSQNG